MTDLKIGFLGGCINVQKGIEKDQYYYEIFSKLIEDVPHKISTGVYISFDKMAEKAERFIAENELDILYLVIRQFPLMPLHKPLVKYENNNGSVSWAVHPALFNRKLQWSCRLSHYNKLNEYVYKKKSRFGLRDLNLLAGKVLGLYNWAPRYVLQEVKKVKKNCDRLGVKLVVISTQRYPTSMMGDLACKQISTTQEKQFESNDIPFVNIIRLGPDLFADDMVHFSAECHRLIATIIYDKTLQIGYLQNSLAELNTVRE
jgi:hypothetical protein